MQALGVPLIPVQEIDRLLDAAELDERFDVIADVTRQSRLADLLRARKLDEGRQDSGSLVRMTGRDLEQAERGRREVERRGALRLAGELERERGGGTCVGLAAPLLGRSTAATSAEPRRSSSATNAPCGSDAIAWIVPARGPRPNRCSANAAVLASGVIGLPRCVVRPLCVPGSANIPYFVGCARLSQPIPSLARPYQAIA